MKRSRKLRRRLEAEVYGWAAPWSRRVDRLANRTVGMHFRWEWLSRSSDMVWAFGVIRAARIVTRMMHRRCLTRAEGAAALQALERQCAARMTSACREVGVPYDET